MADGSRCGWEERDEEIARLRLENAALHGQLREMERFLADYGLHWVGGGCGGGALDDAPDADECHARGAPPPVDMARVHARVEELNALAGDGASMVATCSGPARGLGVLQRVHPLPLSFWDDGLQVGDHPCRTYASAEVGAFLADLYDGYFPYELRHAFPDGTPFLVLDRLGEATGRRGQRHEWGEGRALVARTGETRGAQLLDRGAEGGGGGGGARADGAPHRALGGEGAPSVLLQLRGLSGGPACQLRLPAVCTLSQLRAELALRCALPGTGWEGCELRTAFPNRAYGTSDNGRTLAELGFAPTVTLHLRLLGGANAPDARSSAPPAPSATSAAAAGPARAADAAPAANVPGSARADSRGAPPLAAARAAPPLVEPTQVASAPLSCARAPAGSRAEGGRGRGLLGRGADSLGYGDGMWRRPELGALGGAAAAGEGGAAGSARPASAAGRGAARWAVTCQPQPPAAAARPRQQQPAQRPGSDLRVCSPRPATAAGAATHPRHPALAARLRLLPAPQRQQPPHPSAPPLHAVRARLHHTQPVCPPASAADAASSRPARFAARPVAAEQLPAPAVYTR